MSTKKKILLIISSFVIVLVTAFMASATEDAGKITVSKTATKSSDRTADISLKISANPLDNISVDVVFVLDKSGSMSYSMGNSTRIEVAKKSAKDMVNALLTDETIDSVKVGIVTFGSDIIENNTSGSLTNDKQVLLTLIDNIKGSNNEATNVQIGLNRAKTLLSNSSADKKIIILLSDGKPTKFTYNNQLCGDGGEDSLGWFESYSCWNSGLIPSTAAIAEAESLKNDDTEIYTIGFGSSVSEFENFLKNDIATDTDHYYKATDADELKTVMSTITNRISAVVATSVKVEDVIPVGFDISEESKAALIAKYENISFSTNDKGETVITVDIGDLYANQGDYTIDYTVEADEDHYGAMYTNSSATLTGIATDENKYYADKNLEFTFDKPVVYIEMNTEDDDYTSTPVANGEKLTISAEDGILKKVNTQGLHDSLIKHEDIAVTGSNGESVSESIKVNDEIIYTNPSCGIVSVNNDGSFVYEANEDCVGDVTFDYYVKSTIIVTDKEGNTTTSEIISNTSTVTIRVIETETFYTVRYLEEGTNKVLHTEKVSIGYVFDDVTENAIDIQGYEISGDSSKTITLVKESNSNIINFYYKRVNAEVDEPTIEKQGPSEAITSTTEKVPYTITYTTSMDKYIGTANITIVDTLDYSIDVNNSNLDGGTYDETSKTITWVENFDVNTYENKNNTITVEKEISLSYIYPELDGTEDKIKNQVTGTTHVDTSVDKEKTDTEYTDFDVKGNLIVKHIYINKDGEEVNLVPPVTTEEKVGTSYTTSERTDIVGYNVKTIPANQNGKYTEDDIVVTYIYDKVPAEIKNPSISKTGNDEVTKIGEIVNYRIFHQFTLNDYKGDATITIVDTLPYHIDLNKSDLNGGVYNASNKTITWTKKVSNIDTFTTGEQTINTAIEFSVVYTDLDATEASMNNHASATVSVDTASDNTAETDKETEINIAGKVIINYVDESGSELLTSKEQTGKVGTSYTTTAEAIKGYELAITPSNQNGVYQVNDTQVTYVYKRVAATIDNPIITKTGTTEITNSTDALQYKIIYTSIVKNFSGNVTVTVVDTLPYEIDESKSDLNGGIYNNSTKTITWIETFENITPEEERNLNIEKNITVYYKNIDKTAVSMNNIVKASSKDDLGNTSKEVTDNQETLINISGNVITKYVDEDGKEIAEFTSTTGKVGTSYQTTSKEIQGYENPTVISGQANGNYIEGNLEVVYEYKRVKASITDEKIVKQSSVEKITSSNSLIDYNINYSGIIDQYIGTATYKVVDYLPYEIDESKSDLDGGIYNKDAKTITWLVTADQIDTYQNGKEYVNVNKSIVLKYINVDSNTSIINRVTGEIITETASSEDPVSTTETVISEIKGNVIVEYIYINEIGEEILLDKNELTGYVGDNYQTTALSFNGYKLINNPSNKEGNYIENTITVRYIYDRVEAQIEESELIKVSNDSVITSINNTFSYTITYSATIKDYIGKAVTIITDYLPYEIDLVNSNLDGGIYDEVNKTITWEESFGVDSYNNINNQIYVEKNIQLIYLNVDPSLRQVENKVVSELITETAPTKEEEDTTITILEVKGIVTIRYVDASGNILSDTVKLEGFVGDEYQAMKKDIDGYRLVKVDGNQNGEFIDGEIMVQYVYEKIEEDIILPPKTGVNKNYLSLIISSIFLFMLAMRKRIFTKK